MRSLYVIVALSLAGCLDNPAVECGSRLCPPNTVCVAALSYCARPDQLTSCNGLADGSTCPNGACRSSVCVESVCGNGVVDGLEDCDGADLGDNDCFSAGGYYSGALGCKSDCRFDLGGCVAGGKCGDGTVDVGHELCDGAALQNKSCTDFGYYEASGLACSGACTFDVAKCSERCGDGVINGPELCDGALPGASACLFAGHDAGQLGCSGACTVTPTHCADFAWTLDYTGQSQVDYRWMWGLGSTFFAAAWANPSKVLRSDGGAWTVTPGPAGMTPMSAFWGASTNDVFAVGSGSGGTLGIYHYDGASWTKMTTPSLLNSLAGVWGSSSSDVWAVGSGGILVHYNGATWSSVTSPTSQALYKIWGTSATNIWAVGAAGTVLHYTGSWTSSTVGSGPLYDVWGRSATEIYAVGGGTIYRYDGNNWQPQPSCTTGGMLQISGIPGGGAFLVGGGGAGNEQCQLADGSWFKITSAQSLALESTAATSAGVVSGGSETLVRNAGANYLEMVQPSSTVMPSLVDAYVRAGNDIYLVGHDISGNGNAAHWNGTAWSADTLPAGTKNLADVAGAQGTPVFAVGGDYTLDKGNIVKNVGGTWTTEFVNTGSFLWGVAVLDATHAYAVGVLGTIWTWNGSTWTQVTPAPTTYDLVAVAATSANDVWAVGGVGRIVHFNGTSWTTMQVGNQSLKAILAAAANDIWVVGDAGTILHYDGFSWRTVASATTANLKAIVGGTKERIIVGSGVILEWVGGHWQPMATPYIDDSVNTSRLAGHGDFILFVGGFTGSHGSPQLVGFGGSAFRYTSSESECGDFWDDDLDGAIDCADSDCASDSVCAAGGVCAGAVDLACGASVSGTTSGGPAKWPAYGCSGKAEPGAERYYRFTPSVSGTATFALSGFTGDLDVLVAGSSSSGACLPDASCLGGAQTTGATESVTVSVQAGKTYYVIVDGQAASAFSVSATCQ